MKAFSEEHVLSDEQLEDIADNRNLLYKLYRLLWIVTYIIGWTYVVNNNYIKYEDVVLLTVLTAIVGYLVASVMWAIVSTIYDKIYIGEYSHRDLFLPLIQCSVKNDTNYCDIIEYRTEEYPEIDAYIRNVIQKRELYYGDYLVTNVLKHRADQEKEKVEAEKTFRESCIKLHSKY